MVYEKSMTNEEWLKNNKDQYRGKYVALYEGELLSWGIKQYYCHECLPPKARMYDGTDFAYQMYYISEKGEVSKI